MLDGLKKAFRNSVGYLSIAGALSFGYLTGCSDLGTEPIKPVIPPTPKYTQVATLENYVDINYTANLENTNEAKRKTFYNGSLQDSTTITSSPYLEILSNKPKGQYMFVLESTGTKPDTAFVEIPNYQPEANFSSLQTSIYADSQKTFNLQNLLSDKNPEDNPVPLVNAESLDGKTSVNVAGYDVNVNAFSTTGQYQVGVNIGSAVGGLEQKILSGQILQAPVVPYGQIAFWHQDRSNPNKWYEDIYKGDLVKTAEGKDTLVNLTQLTTDLGDDLEPAWSPDGRYILFTSTRTKRFAVWKMDENGGNQMDISSHLVERARQADWGSNGKIVVAYTDSNSTKAGIGIIDPIADTFTSIYSQPNIGGVPEWPSWSPDCSEIAFARYADGNWDVWKIKANKDSLTNLTKDLSTDGSPDWSPGGNYIFFKSNRFGSADIFRMNSFDGSNQTRITDNPGIETDIARGVSPNGSKLIFTHDIDLSNSQIYITESNGTNWVKLTFEEANAYPAWRPNP